MSKLEELDMINCKSTWDYYWPDSKMMGFRFDLSVNISDLDKTFCLHLHLPYNIYDVPSDTLYMVEQYLLGSLAKIKTEVIVYLLDKHEKNGEPFLLDLREINKSLARVFNLQITSLLNDMGEFVRSLYVKSPYTLMTYINKSNRKGKPHIFCC